MSILKCIVSCLVVLFLSLGTKMNAQDVKIRSLDCIEFFTSLNNNNDIKLFDVRDVSKYEESRIINSQLAETKERFSGFLKDINKTDSIFIYCEIGKRSKECSEWLVGMGFKNVFQLENGFEAWVKDNFPIDDSIIEIVDNGRKK